MSRRKRWISRLSAALRGERMKNARTSLRVRTTPGEPRSMRKLAIASRDGGGALRESCSHETGTDFLCHRAARVATSRLWKQGLAKISSANIKQVRQRA